MFAAAKVGTLIGALAICHSGLSALYYIRDTEEETIPMSILLVLFLGLFLVLIGSVMGLPEFRSARGIKQLNAQKRDELFDRPAFRRYNHGAATYRRILQQQ